MSFGAAIKSGFSQYATFEGRARRSEFWWFYLFLFLIQLPIIVTFYVLMFWAFLPVFEQADASGAVPDGAWGDVRWLALIVGGTVIMVAAAFLYIPFLSMSARRLHDMGQTGHWLWLMLAGLGIVPLIMAFFDSEHGTNRWGPDPKADERIAPPGYAGPPPGYGTPPPQG